ncbi:hypothetical protein FNH22_27735 [Fulvivirga sp. M361]|uniref:hypothetical protein n=1 Tax=Fulvivirga sp. M361 TaxID=2594266 RepID=UPI00117AC147|nr:hypothetical protein [Fulvivirga sp. M361]TRX49027.1 hypothetical protein FNH22_27735 [Fulvivirga sp. M361]
MNKKDRIEEIMHSVGGMQRAKAPADAFSKIRQKLADPPKEQETSSYRWLGVAAVILLVICSNVVIISNYYSNESWSQHSDYLQLTSDFNLYENG